MIDGSNHFTVTKATKSIHYEIIHIISIKASTKKPSLLKRLCIFECLVVHRIVFIVFSCIHFRKDWISSISAVYIIHFMRETRIVFLFCSNLFSSVFLCLLQCFRVFFRFSLFCTFFLCRWWCFIHCTLLPYFHSHFYHCHILKTTRISKKRTKG